jgi:hypothetical protein
MADTVAGQGAHSHALSLIHTEVGAFRSEMAEFRQETGDEFAEVNGRLGRIAPALDTILTRLPEQPAQD